VIIQVLGVGGAFSPEIGNSSFFIVDKNGKGILLDCGYTVYPKLKKLELIDHIDTVLITHTHGDHIGSLDTLLFHRRYILSKKTWLVSREETMVALEGIDPAFVQERHSFFHADELRDQYLAVDNPHTTYVSSTGFFVDDNVFISGDTSESLLNLDRLKKARLIFHEVTFYPKSEVHTTFEELCKADAETKAKTWLYHYNVGDYEKHNKTVLDNGFAGMLIQDQILEVADERI